MTAETPDVVRVAGAAKRFVIRKDSSLKERLVGFAKPASRHREEFWALRDVNVTIRAGETVGLIGHNGSGKSTLLKLIGGIFDPTQGTVEHRGRVAALIELGTGFHPDLTGRENVYLNAALLGLTQREVSERFDDIVAFSEIGDFIDTQVKFYSSGMFVRLAFAVAVHTDPDILLVDEVLAVGDEAFQRKCMNRIDDMRRSGVTIIIVTHALDQIVEVCDRAVLLDHGQVLFDGMPREAIVRLRELLYQPDGHDDRAGIGIESVVARAVGGEPRTPIEAGDDIEIDVVLHGVAQLDNWVATVQVDTTAGHAMWGEATALQRAGGPDRAVVRFRLSRPAFAVGPYFVNAAVLDAADRRIAHTYVMHAAQFEIVSDEHRHGLVHVDVAVDVDAAD